MNILPFVAVLNGLSEAALDELELIGERGSSLIVGLFLRLRCNWLISSCSRSFSSSNAWFWTEKLQEAQENNHSGVNMIIQWRNYLRSQFIDFVRFRVFSFFSQCHCQWYFTFQLFAFVLILLHKQVIANFLAPRTKKLPDLYGAFGSILDPFEPVRHRFCSFLQFVFSIAKLNVGICRSQHSLTNSVYFFIAICCWTASSRLHISSLIRFLRKQICTWN